LDPFRDWICEQLQADPKVPSQRLRELAVEIGYAGGKTIFDAYVREVRPRFLVTRTFQRTIYRPAELVQCDLWEPSRHVPRPGGPISTQPDLSPTPGSRIPICPDIVTTCYDVAFWSARGRPDRGDQAGCSPCSTVGRASCSSGAPQCQQ
jgi:hypothetical protein